VKWSALTTAPPARPPSPKAPLFTTKLHSTKSFSPGHLLGAGILVVGIAGLTKFFVARGRALAERTQVAPQPSNLAQAESTRGEYGNRR